MLLQLQGTARGPDCGSPRRLLGAGGDSSKVLAAYADIAARCAEPFIAVPALRRLVAQVESARAEAAELTRRLDAALAALRLRLERACGGAAARAGTPPRRRASDADLFDVRRAPPAVHPATAAGPAEARWSQCAATPPSAALHSARRPALLLSPCVPEHPAPPIAPARRSPPRVISPAPAAAQPERRAVLATLSRASPPRPQHPAPPSPPPPPAEAAAAAGASQLETGSPPPPPLERLRGIAAQGLAPPLGRRRGELAAALRGDVADARSSGCSGPQLWAAQRLVERCATAPEDDLVADALALLRYADPGDGPCTPPGSPPRALLLAEGGPGPPTGHRAVEEPPPPPDDPFQDGAGATPDFGLSAEERCVIVASARGDPPFAPVPIHADAPARAALKAELVAFSQALGAGAARGSGEAWSDGSSTCGSHSPDHFNSPLRISPPDYARGVAAGPGRLKSPAAAAALRRRTGSVTFAQPSAA
eukprot:TRINITY_DN13714_c0_g1_i1.p1 TRINITY_DN13714_c0_g1~~TRINITY_DN13714_c0_g1_i1.p1  ORF type:complete len:516 (+),score=85.58 TRINITY_DN13714_c0_g1_i1:106-1548(+)